MRFTVVVPIYNVGKYLAECIESIMRQTFDDFEVILVDDGSTDNSGDLCDSACLADSRFRVFHKKNGGLVSSRKIGVSYSEGEYIVQIDGDDYVDENYLKSANEIIERFHPDIIAFSHKMIWEGGGCRIIDNCADEGMYVGDEMATIRDGFLYSKRIHGPNSGIINFSLCTKIVKSTLYRANHHLVDDSITVGEDLLMTALLIENSNSLYVSKSHYYNYRILDCSMMHKFDLRGATSVEKVISFLATRNWCKQSSLANYSFAMLELQISKLGKASEDYSYFKKGIGFLKTLNTFWLSSLSIDRHILNRKQKTKLYFLKHNLFVFLFFFLKRG